MNGEWSVVVCRTDQIFGRDLKMGKTNNKKRGEEN